MSSASRRVVITGFGLISPLGNSPEAVWEALRAGRSGVGPLTCLPEQAVPTRVAGEARSFAGRIGDFGDLNNDQKRKIRKGLKVMCREIQMGVAAAQLALQDSRLQAGDYDQDRTGIVSGCDHIVTQPEEFTEGIRSCLDEQGQFQFGRWATDGLPKVTPLWLLKYLPNMPASHLAIFNELRGPNNSITMREASSNLAVAEAYSTIARGDAEIMIAGATGTRLHPLRAVQVSLQEQIAPGDGEPGAASRPFDRDREGMVLGEGAAAIVLEDLRTAESRGARIWGEVVGAGCSAVLDRQGRADISVALQNVIRLCLQRSGCQPQELGHIHAHGIATVEGDIQEARAIAAVFGKEGGGVPVTAAKSYTGNLGAASGLVELIASVIAMNEGFLFPILNYRNADPAATILAVREGGGEPGSSFLNLSATPQGQASGVLIRYIS